MLVDFVSISKSLFQHGLQFLAITGVQFALFFVFIKYKTGQQLDVLFKLYVQLFVRALMFTLMLLCIIVILTKYSSMCTIAVLLLAVSSVSIAMKYFDLLKENKAIICDLWILLSNAYVMYSLATNDPVSVVHYLVLYSVVLYVFLYQRLKVVYLK